MSLQYKVDSLQSFRLKRNFVKIIVSLSLCNVFLIGMLAMQLRTANNNIMGYTTARHIFYDLLLVIFRPQINDLTVNNISMGNTNINFRRTTILVCFYFATTRGVEFVPFVL